MVGQGSPLSLRAGPQGCARRTGRWLVPLALALWLATSLAAQAAETTLRLRVAWGGGTARRWQGTLRLTAGTLSELRPLGIEADEVGSLWLDGSAVVVAQRAARADDGFDVLATAELTDSLVVELAPHGEQQDPPPPIQIPLQDLLAGSRSQQLDESGNRLLVMRTPGDALRVSIDRAALVYAAGEPLLATVEPHLIGVAPGGSFRVRAQLVGGGGAKLWSQDYDAKASDGDEPAAPLQIETTLPAAEGVYELTLSAVGSRVPWSKPLVERKVQLVVIGERPPPAGTAQPTRLYEFDPAQPRWYDRLANLPLLPQVRKGPLGSGHAARWEHPQLGPLMQLGPGGREPEVTWEAYPLPIDRPGQTHLLEVEYPSDVPQTLGLSLVEPNAANMVVPIGLDSGVYTSSEPPIGAPRMLKHRIPFWPRTKSPLLLVTNRRPGSPAVYGRIRVLGAASSQFGALSLARRETSFALPRAADGGRRGERLLAAYFDRPLLAENFSAPESLDSFSRRSLDDWHTFYLGGSRLVEYLHYQGYNGAIVSVLEGGSAIYPSELVEPTPQHDTGVYFASGQDVLRKDVLELLLRLFDREGLQLVPALSFTTGLPELEALRRAGGPETAGLDWVGPAGPAKARGAVLPRYNPLDARVQEAVAAVVRELATRYAHHPALAGVALQLSADGFAQLPASEGSYDDATIARFERDARVRVPGRGAERFAARAEYLTRAGSAAWLAWRAAEIARFHRRLCQELLAARPDAKLYLAGAGLLDSPAHARLLRPALPPRANWDGALLQMGIRPENYARDEGIVLLRPQRLSPPAALASQATDLEWNQAPEVDRLFSLGSQAGSLLFHVPQRARMPSFDAQSPFGQANTYTALVAQLSPSGDLNRQRLSHSLAQLDSHVIADGGWLLPLGQEEATRAWISVYRQLPAGRFETLSRDTQPVVIRSLTRGAETFVYLVNDSPWNCQATVNVKLPAGGRMEKLGESAGLEPLAHSADGAILTANLKAYELCAARFTGSGVRLSAARVRLPDDTEAALRRRLQDLGARAAALGRRAPLALLANPGMERSAGADEVPGWEAAVPPGCQVLVDRTHKRSGEQSLKLASNAARVAIRSNPFPPPQTGRLTVELWLRCDDAARQPALRMAVEGVREEGPYYRYATVGGSGRGAVPLEEVWRPYVFQIDDVPVEKAHNLRVSFELLGPGQVWIDDVQLFDLAFSDGERVELAKIINLATFKLQSGKVSDCARLLEGYWPQFLLANVPLGVAQNPQPKARVEPAEEPPREPAAPPRSPGVLEQMKNLTPKFIRKRG